MKKLILLAGLVIASSVCLFGQVTPPAVPDNANIYDNNIKMRSIDMERVKRDEQREEAAKFAPVNSKIEAKFPEIKEDFESLQTSQSAVVTAYTTGSKPDYAAIEAAAEEINKKAKRLDANLFPDATSQEVKSEDSKKKEEKPKTVRDLIVELDDAIGSFVSSKIFVNLKVIEPEVAIKTRTDLLKIQTLSQKLAEEAKKMK
jgi:hypothetical protein